MTTTAPRVLGLDLSLTATGICMPDGTTCTITTRAKDGDRRLLQIAATLTSVVASTRPDLAVVEDLPKHAMAAGITGMVHGVARVVLLEARVPYAFVVPATLKAYATGRGAGDKSAMILAAYKRAGVEFADDNQCDAWWLRAAGLAYLGYPPVDLPAVQQDALTKVAWPPMAASVMPFAPAGTHRGAVTAHVPGGEVA